MHSLKAKRLYLSDSCKMFRSHCNESKPQLTLKGIVMIQAHWGKPLALINQASVLLSVTAYFTFLCHFVSLLGRKADAKGVLTSMFKVVPVYFGFNFYVSCFVLKHSRYFLIQLGVKPTNHDSLAHVFQHFTLITC